MKIKDLKNVGKVLGVVLMYMVVVMPVTSMAGIMETAAAPEPSLMNELEWNVSDITAIEVSYASDRVAVLPSINGTIVLKEYLTEHHTDYYASAEVKDSVLKIDSGARPSGSYVSRIELYVPDTMNGSVKVNTTSGKIEIRGYHGALDVTALSGKIEVVDSAISGCLTNKSGAIEVHLIGLNGDLSVIGGSGKITATIGTAIDFNLVAGTGTGKVVNNFSNAFDTSTTAVTGSWGSNPVNTMTLRSDSSTVTIHAK